MRRLNEQVSFGQQRCAVELLPLRPRRLCMFIEVLNPGEVLRVERGQNADQEFVVLIAKADLRKLGGLMSRFLLRGIRGARNRDEVEAVRGQIGNSIGLDRAIDDRRRSVMMGNRALGSNEACRRECTSKQAIRKRMIILQSLTGNGRLTGVNGPGRRLEEEAKIRILQSGCAAVERVHMMGGPGQHVKGKNIAMP